jgi:hypothetical protein
MKLWKKLLAFGLLALPAMLSAQWALYNSSGPPHSLLAAPGGGWVVASAGNIFKLSPEGKVVWGQRFSGGGNFSNCLKAWLAPDGGIVAVGDNSFGGVATLFKLSAAGSVVWEKTYTLASTFLDVFCPTPDGGALMAGGLDSDLFICRFSAEGEIVWQKSYGTSDVDRATAAAPTSDGGVIVLGSCTPTDFGATSDLWVLKLTSTGEVEWQKRIGGAADDGAGTVFQTADGGYLIAGYSASFNTDGGSLLWLLKLSPAGTVQRQMALNDGYAWGGMISMRRAADGSFIASFISSPSGPPRVVVVMVAGDGTIIREKPYSSGLYSVSSTAVLPTDDGGCLLSMTGSPSSDDDHADSHLLKILPSGEIEWQKVYGSRYSPDAVYLFDRAGDGGYVLAGATSSWGNWRDAFSFMWVMRTASDGSIGPYYPFVKPAAGSPLDEVSTWTDVAAPVTDTAAVPQSAGLVAEAANIDFAPWGPTELPALGKPTCTLKVGASNSGTTTPVVGSHVYATGAQVQISATPSAEYQFSEWIGNIQIGRPSTTIVMDGDKDIYVFFNYLGEGPIEKAYNKYCFIATAAYGDPSHPHVKILREFRDRYLLKSRVGRSLVDLYYRYSPPVARFVEKHPVLKAVSRAALYPVVAICDLLLKSGTQY